MRDRAWRIFLEVAPWAGAISFVGVVGTWARHHHLHGEAFTGVVGLGVLAVICVAQGRYWLDVHRGIEHDRALEEAYRRGMRDAREEVS